MCLLEEKWSFWALVGFSWSFFGKMQELVAGVFFMCIFFPLDLGRALEWSQSQRQFNAITALSVTFTCLKIA